MVVAEDEVPVDSAGGGEEGVGEEGVLCSVVTRKGVNWETSCRGGSGGGGRFKSLSDVLQNQAVVREVIDETTLPEAASR